MDYNNHQRFEKSKMLEIQGIVYWIRNINAERHKNIVKRGLNIISEIKEI